MAVKFPMLAVSMSHEMTIQWAMGFLGFLALVWCHFLLHFTIMGRVYGDLTDTCGLTEWKTFICITKLSVLVCGSQR